MIRNLAGVIEIIRRELDPIALSLSAWGEGARCTAMEGERWGPQALRPPTSAPSTPSSFPRARGRYQMVSREGPSNDFRACFGHKLVLELEGNPGMPPIQPVASHFSLEEAVARARDHAHGPLQRIVAAPEAAVGCAASACGTSFGRGLMSSSSTLQAAAESGVGLGPTAHDAVMNLAENAMDRALFEPEPVLLAQPPALVGRYTQSPPMSPDGKVELRPRRHPARMRHHARSQPRRPRRRSATTEPP